MAGQVLERTEHKNFDNWAASKQQEGGVFGGYKNYNLVHERLWQHESLVLIPTTAHGSVAHSPGIAMEYAQGFLPRGADVHTSDPVYPGPKPDGSPHGLTMRLSAAKQWCMARDSCAGFTLNGDGQLARGMARDAIEALDPTVECFFKSTRTVVRGPQSTWHSFLKRVP